MQVLFHPTDFFYSLFLFFNVCFYFHIFIYLFSQKLKQVCKANISKHKKAISSTSALFAILRTRGGWGCFVLQYLLSIIILQPSCQGSGSWMLNSFVMLLSCGYSYSVLCLFLTVPCVVVCNCGISLSYSLAVLY